MKKCWLACICLVGLGCAMDSAEGPETTFTTDGATAVEPSADKADGQARVAVNFRLLGRHPFNDPAVPFCEGTENGFQVSYRPGSLPAGSRVYLHRGFGGFDNSWLGDGFCWDTEFFNWHGVTDNEMTLNGDTWTAETSTPVQRNLKRECQLSSDNAAQYLVELDFVFMIVRPDGTVEWDTPNRSGFGSYYRAKTEGELQPQCDGGSAWSSLGAWW